MQIISFEIYFETWIFEVHGERFSIIQDLFTPRQTGRRVKEEAFTYGTLQQLNYQLHDSNELL